MLVWLSIAALPLTAQKVFSYIPSFICLSPMCSVCVTEIAHDVSALLSWEFQAVCQLTLAICILVICARTENLYSSLDYQSDDVLQLYGTVGALSAGAVGLGVALQVAVGDRGFHREVAEGCSLPGLPAQAGKARARKSVARRKGSGDRGPGKAPVVVRRGLS